MFAMAISITTDSVICLSRGVPFFEVMPAEGGVSNYAFPVPWPGRRDHCSIKVHSGYVDCEDYLKDDYDCGNDYCYDYHVTIIVVVNVTMTVTVIVLGL